MQVVGMAVGRAGGTQRVCSLRHLGREGCITSANTSRRARSTVVKEVAVASKADPRTVGCLRGYRVTARANEDDNPAGRANPAGRTEDSEASVCQASLVCANVDDTYHRGREYSTDADGSSGYAVRRCGRRRVRGGIVLYGRRACNGPVMGDDRARASSTSSRHVRLVGHTSDVMETVTVVDRV